MNKVYTSCDFFNQFCDKDLYHEKKIILLIDSLPYIRTIDNMIKYFDSNTHNELVKSSEYVYIFIQFESYAIISGTLEQLINNHQIFNFFNYILTFDERLLQLNSKCIKFLPYVKFFWIRPCLKSFPNLFLESVNVKETFEYNTNKDFNVTFLVGWKNQCVGHKLRHDIWNRQSEIKIPAKIFYSNSNNGMKINENNILINHPHDKTKMFENSMFAIIIENNKSNNYFTEKLIDCIVSKTLPIYYGCPNINEYFDTNGMILFDTTDELINIVNSLTPDDYFKRLNFIEENFLKWLNMKSFSGQLEDILSKITN
jgi:hypothetical protein